MAGNSFGRLFCITTWGESHGPALGVIIDGCPPRIPLEPEDIQRDLERRRPGKHLSSARREPDRVEILAGVFGGVTTGTPISLIIFNRDVRSRDYDELAQLYRPGHADRSYDQKYGVRDWRGGGGNRYRKIEALLNRPETAREPVSRRFGTAAQG